MPVSNVATLPPSAMSTPYRSATSAELLECPLSQRPLTRIPSITVVHSLGMMASSRGASRIAVVFASTSPVRWKTVSKRAGDEQKAKRGRTDREDSAVLEPDLGARGKPG